MDPFEIVDQIRGSRTAQAVGAVLSDAAGAGYGLPTYTIGAMPNPDQPVLTPYLFHNWPDDWTEAYFSRGFDLHNPIPKVASLVSEPISAAEIRAGKAGFRPSPEALAMLDFAASLGRGTALVVPIHGAHGYRRIVSFNGDGPEPGPRARAVLQLWAIHAHHRLRALHARAEAEPDGLTGREIEMLDNLRAGLTDAAIAEATGISVRTVRFHIDNAKRKLGGQTRAEAVARAVQRHMLTL